MPLKNFFKKTVVYELKNFDRAAIKAIEIIHDYLDGKFFNKPAAEFAASCLARKLLGYPSKAPSQAELSSLKALAEYLDQVAIECAFDKIPDKQVKATLKGNLNKKTGRYKLGMDYLKTAFSTKKTKAELRIPDKSDFVSANRPAVRAYKRDDPNGVNLDSVFEVEVPDDYDEIKVDHKGGGRTDFQSTTNPNFVYKILTDRSTPGLFNLVEYPKNNANQQGVTIIRHATEVFIEALFVTGGGDFGTVAEMHRVNTAALQNSMPGNGELPAQRLNPIKDTGENESELEREEEQLRSTLEEQRRLELAAEP